MIGPGESSAALGAAADLEAFLRDRLAGEARFDPMSRALYSTDASIYQITPVGVVLPRSEADVEVAVRAAAERGVPILPRGGGTSLSGQTVAAALVVDFSRFMNRILQIDAERRLAQVEPGVVLDAFNARLAPLGLTFGPDVATSSRANLGGMIGNNSAGSRSVRQGKTIDHVRAVRALLSDGSWLDCQPCTARELAQHRQGAGRPAAIHRGVEDIVARNRGEILKRYPRLLRRVSGYNLDAFVPEIAAGIPRPAEVARLDRDWPDRRDFNLSRLLVGAEGTLGTITRATVHLVPLPAVRGVVCLEFRTIDHALESVTTILQTQPTAIELLDRNIIELSRANLKYRNAFDFVGGTPDALLIVEYSGDSPQVVADGLLLLEGKLRGWPGLERFFPASDPAQALRIWNCRKAGAPLLLSIPGARKPIAFVEDTAVAPARLPEFTARFRALLTRFGVTGAYYGHASVGCLHIRPMLDTKSARDLALLKAVSDAVAELVLEFGGAMSGEHGDGLARSYHNLKLFGPKLFQAFAEVKKLFDPAGLMNPGKITHAPSPIADLRYGPAYPGAHAATRLNFDREAAMAGAPGQGFLAAAEMCNGSGVCRKTLSGTMCPSFMATGDEEHSTRGRANALRLALTGALGPEALFSERMHEVMELCLMCKACKAECPSNVDLAKLKVEFLAGYHARHGVPWRDVLLANAGWLNRLGSALAPAVNWLSRMPLTGRAAKWLLGVDQRRGLPRFEFQNLQRWFARRRRLPAGASQGRVILLDDCLTSFCEPGIGRAAVELLEAAGHDVILAGLWCCGRPYLSKGLVDEARGLALANISRLQASLDEGVPVLAVEPSCLLTLTDEYPDLIPSAAAGMLRRNAFLVDEWLARRAAASANWPRDGFGPLDATALLHGHCQQKALLGTSGARHALGLVPGLKIEELDAGCCGMAGSFGYEHFDISQKIGQRVLFPAVRGHSAGPVVAPGFSCRHQIAEATGRRAVHPLELLYQQWRGAARSS